MPRRLCFFVVSALLASNLFAQDAEESAPRRSARKLIDAIGTREQIPQMMGPLLEAAAKQMANQPDGSSCNNDFLTEWKKRFAERFSADRVIELIVPIYEKHFTAEEIDQLTAIRVAANQGKRQDPSKELLEKLQKEGIELQSEIVGATTQLGAKIGAEAGQQINVEHPDWCTHKAEGAKKQ